MQSSTETSSQTKDSSFVIEPWNVILLNDDWHTFQEVIIQLCKATRCTPQQASVIAWEAHDNGEAVCYTGPKERCEHVGYVLDEIELDFRIERML